MYPYDYSKENYFRTGFVAEGVTTYMGDLMLHKSGVTSWQEFVKTQNQNLERHLMNYGRFNLSVADSGFDSWLDGYKLGAPNRKVSIYADGALCMLMIDLEIINFSEGENSLNTVMNELYTNFAQKKIGYSEEDFKNICLKYGGENIIKIFDNHVYGTKNYVPTLKNQLQHIGLRLKDKKNPSLSAQFFGFLGLFQDKKIIIKKVEPNSEADKKHIAPKDQITKINGKEINKPLNEILKECEKEVYVTIKKKFTEKEIKLTIGNYFSLKEIDSVKLKNTKQIRNFNFWIS
jgi:predicted metalloprotease with PDZ domain